MDRLAHYDWPFFEERHAKLAIEADAWAHANLAQGMQEGEVMMLAGWRSREMLRRYAASTATERALDAARRSGLADRL